MTTYTCRLASQFGMRRSRNIALATFISLLLVTISCGGRTTNMTVTQEVPSAAGWVKVEEDDNNNTVVEMEVRHLPKPDLLTPARNEYVVWIQPRGKEAENAGRLTVNDNLSGMFTTTTPHRAFDIFVTAEDSPSPTAPTGTEIMRATASR
jgi:hypothetical protein